MKSVKELCSLYNIRSRRTFIKKISGFLTLEPYQQLLTPQQVDLIFEKLGNPY